METKTEDDEDELPQPSASIQRESSVFRFRLPETWGFSRAEPFRFGGTTGARVPKRRVQSYLL